MDAMIIRINTTLQLYFRIYLTIMLKAPSGVTRIAGAKAYATKFSTSPMITVA